MLKKRNWMKTAAKKIEFPLSSEFECQEIDLSQIRSLGILMDSSYRDTIDYDGETLEQCIQEMSDTLSGKYGPFISSASFVVNFGKVTVSAILITEWKGEPLVAYTMTDKNFQGKGLAKYLLGKSVSSLVTSRWRELFLVVTEGNLPAEKLYEKVGFKRVGLALPGAPPPTA